ncbi:MAG: hypothetical protein AB1486_01845 [Planctomycetota bacterium]
MVLMSLLFTLLMALLAQEPTPFEVALAGAEAALAAGDHDRAREWIDRAAERDRKSRKVWSLRTRWAEAKGDRDELVYSLHQELRLAVAQKAPKAERVTLRQRLEAIDPIAPDLLDLELLFLEKLVPVADYYEKERRPHSAIRVHQEILALDPERRESEEAILRLSAAPDPSLAETAKPKDLFAGVSEEWIEQFDAKHSTWDKRAQLEREHYVTHTDAGYEVMVRAAEAMEQMNAFYREFFQYGMEGDSRKVPRIELHIFKERDEYLKYGSGPPVEWSGGQFTGSAVETYISTGGFEGMVSVLFHEAAHQFVGLATTAVGWLNEGLASFFEGCRILPNGVVQMNMPANHRLFPLAERMERGWMRDSTDGINPQDPAAAEPEKAPTFRIVIENRYAWGPPWYAPTWGVVYFLFNYQDPADGRFVYRPAFHEFIDESGGRGGEGAVRNFEEVVLSNPAPPTKGVDFAASGTAVKLARTAEELDEVWKDWILKLRDEQSGRLEVERPYLAWAKYAVERKDFGDALEHFEKGLVSAPSDVDLLEEFAKFLVLKKKNTDRASKLLHQALRVLEFEEEPDPKRLEDLDRLLARWDPKHRMMLKIHDELYAAARNLCRRYLDESLPLMAMDVSWHFGTDLRVKDVFRYFEEAVRQSGKSIWIWKLAYNEQNLDGWLAAGNDVYTAEGPILRSRFGTYKPDDFSYQFLTLDEVTSGDFSMEAEVLAEEGINAFCGLVFGKKSDQTFHALVLFPGQTGDARYAKAERSGYVDLTSFYGAGSYKIWRHNPVGAQQGPVGAQQGPIGAKKGWHKLRVDIAGRLVDVWFDDELVVTHEFPSVDVLRGGFGIVTGPGEAQWRNVRYLARPAVDPGALIEREVRLEKQRAQADSGAGSSEAGPSEHGARSYVGRVPPWPEQADWLQAPRSSWEERGPVPTLLVFWSIEQNAALPIDKWLNDFAKRNEEIGLQIVSIAAPDDRGKLEAYLQEHPFPGSVGCDKRLKRGYGALFERYWIERYGMPRLLLLDVDHKVFWEGDPGLAFGKTWQAGETSYVDAPLEDLVARRNLRALFRFQREWKEWGEAVAKAGDLERALPLLRLSATLDASLVPEVSEARKILDGATNAVEAIVAVGRTLQRQECEPAVLALIEWAKLLEREIDERMMKGLKAVLDHGRARSWQRTLKEVAEAQAKVAPDKERRELERLVDKLSKAADPFTPLLVEELRAALEADDLARAEAALRNLRRYPEQWLAREYFRW